MRFNSALSTMISSPIGTAAVARHSGKQHAMARSARFSPSKVQRASSLLPSQIRSQESGCKRPIRIRR